MDTCNIILVVVIFVLIVAVSNIKIEESFVNRDMRFVPSNFSRKPNEESCWQNIRKHKNWNLNALDKNEKKVLLTMRRLNAKSYEDDSKFFPGWKNSCVIPKEHLPIYNKSVNDYQNWDLYNPNNPNPDPNSKGFMRYTNISEFPKGYVVDLNKHNFNSFRQVLKEAHKLYDKEFFDEKARLEEEIRRWQAIKRQREEHLRWLRAEIPRIDGLYNQLVQYWSQCQQDRRMYEQLQAEYNRLYQILISI